MIRMQATPQQLIYQLEGLLVSSVIVDLRVSLDNLQLVCFYAPPSERFSVDPEGLFYTREGYHFYRNLRKTWFSLAHNLCMDDELLGPETNEGTSLSESRKHPTTACKCCKGGGFYGNYYQDSEED